MLVDIVTKTSYTYKITLEDFNKITHIFEIDTKEQVEEKDVYRLLISNIRDIVYDFSTKSLKIYDRDNLVQIEIPLDFNIADLGHLIHTIMEIYNIDKDLKSRKLIVPFSQGIACLVAVLFNETILTNVKVV